MEQRGYPKGADGLTDTAPDTLTEEIQAPRPATVLIVDDEAPLLRLLQFVLERQGYRLLTASDGGGVLSLIRQHRPDLVILDIMLPTRDGYSILEAIRAEPTLAETPVILLSAKAQDADIARGMATGADRYITKPFHPESLTEIIAGFLPAPLRGRAPEPTRA